MKKINSEIKVNNDIFKIKVGTINKKNPETIYLEIGTYLMPILLKSSYSEDFDIIYKYTAQYIKTLLSNDLLFSKDFILVNDVATDRMLPGKKSYLEMQLYLKPKKETLKKSFKNIAEDIKQSYLLKLTSYIKNSIGEKGYILSKMKI